MMEDGVRRSEVFRYLGYGNRVPDEETGELAEECIKELLRVSEERICVRESPGDGAGREPGTGAVCQTSSRSLFLKNLGGCARVLVMAATLGTGVDRLLLKYGKLFMARAVVMQAAAAALIEEVCDRNFESWRKEYEEKGLYLRPRFSPGLRRFAVKRPEGPSGRAGGREAPGDHSDRGRPYDAVQIRDGGDRDQSGKGLLPDRRVRGM